MKVIIIGGVAGGGSCAARLRRLDDRLRSSVYDLEEAELCYVPPFGSAKDPVNFAGMMAADILRGDMPLVHWDTTQPACWCRTDSMQKLFLAACCRAPIRHCTNQLAHSR